MKKVKQTTKIAGSPSWTRTNNLAVNSRPLYHWAIGEWPGWPLAIINFYSEASQIQLLGMCETIPYILEVSPTGIEPVTCWLRVSGTAYKKVILRSKPLKLIIRENGIL